jgi:deoxyguanosine kinase
MQRIALRDRVYERNMDPSYIADLANAYDAHFTVHYNGPPALTIDTDKLDFVSRPKDLRWIADRVADAVRDAPQQPELPLGAD